MIARQVLPTNPASILGLGNQKRVSRPSNSAPPNLHHAPAKTTMLQPEKMPGAKDLTLIVAATKEMGIGLKGTLPWTGLKKEMAYFARVTKRVVDGSGGKRNTVIMGRKTWESIPPRFRPLKDRLNVVITSTPEKLVGEKCVAVKSLTEAVEKLEGRGFVIGGAGVYGEALKGTEARRVLLTRVGGSWEVDTWFPAQIGGNGDGAAEGWVRKGKEEFDGWVGEDVPGGEQEEAGVKYEFEMWERA